MADESNPEDILKPWRALFASGKPAVHMLADLPITLSASPAGLVQLDFPFALMGLDQAGIQRLSIAVTPSVLRAALEVLEKNPDKPVELKRPQESAN